jgi:hypothetical protein
MSPPASPEPETSSHWEEIVEGRVWREGRGDPRPYPTLLPFITEHELSRRTSALETAWPGWTIVLDPFGLLFEARCMACSRDSAAKAPIDGADREAALRFVDENDELLGVDERGKSIYVDAPNLVVFDTPVDSIGFHISRRDGVITVRPHAWPHLPPTQTMDADVLKERLRAIYPGADVSYELERLHFVARTMNGPLEIHQAACWRSRKDDQSDLRHAIADLPARPCVDARTGDDLTGVEIAWTVVMENGVVRRRVFRPAPSETGGFHRDEP